MGMKRNSNHFPIGGGGGGPSKRTEKIPFEINNKKPIFDARGNVTFNSISARREFFLGKSIARLEHVLNEYGYQTTRRASTHRGSKAKFIVTLNPSKDRNITQIQVTPGSRRHGNVPYVKISTSDIGRIKIVASDSQTYKTDNKENAHILFRRKK